MISPSFTRRVLIGLISLIPLLGTAQTSGGERVDKPGLALVKPQAWSKEGEATVLEFLAVTNHSGYYEFRTAKNPNNQIPTAKVVKLVIYPESPQSLTSAEERASLQKILNEYAGLSAKFPSATRQLEAAVAPLKSDAAKYDAGNVKEGGQWVLRSAYFKQKATGLASLLRQELSSAGHIKEVDLTTNQYYLGIQELAKSEPSVTPVLEGIRTFHASLVRKADRDALLNQLNSPALSYEQAVVLVKQLKQLQPAEDARANLYVQGWDAAVAKAGDLTGQITAVQARFEDAIPAPGDSAKLPVIPPEVAASIESLSTAIAQYRAGSPPSAIQVPLPVADALIACTARFPELDKQLAAREYLDAKLVLDPLADKAILIGPKTAQCLSAVQKKVTADIEKFQVLRNEAKMLAENDKIEAALKKYNEALAIIPAKDVAAQIQLLKKQ